MTEKTLVLHVGGHKTGSTSIQTALAQSKWDLQLQGIRYFNNYARSSQLLSKAFRKFDPDRTPLKGGYASGLHMRRASFAAWLKLSRVVRQNAQPFTIISEEYLLRLQELDRMKRLLDMIFDRVVIVVYVRNPLARMPSSIDQRIRGGTTLATLATGPAGIPLVLPKLENYATAFGRDNVIVRNFDMQNLTGGTPEADFAAVLAQVTKQQVTLTPVERMNQSLPAAVTACLLRQNEAAFAAGRPMAREDFQRRNALIAMIRKDAGLAAGPKLHLNDPALIAHVTAVFQDEVAAINRRFLGGQIQIALPEKGKRLNKSDFQARLAQWVFSFEDPAKNAAIAQLAKQV